MSYKISNLPTYPQNGQHQQITIYDVYPFPLKITRGEDTWYFYNDKGLEEAIKPNLWYVFVGRDYMMNQGFKTKGFRKPDIAVRYAMREYKKWLRLQLKKIQKFKIEESQ